MEGWIDAHHWQNQKLEEERHTAASLGFGSYEVVEMLVIPGVSSSLTSMAVVVLLLVWKPLEGLVEEETDPWRILCHGILWSDLDQAGEVLDSHLNNKQM